MSSANQLVEALPLRDIKVKFGSYGNCGGMAMAIVDLEPGTGPGVEMVDAMTELPAWAEDFRDIVEFCVEHLGVGIRAELREVVGAELAIRAVVRRVHPNPVDANERVYRGAGELVVREAARLAGLEPDETG